MNDGVQRSSTGARAVRGMPRRGWLRTVLVLGAAGPCGGLHALVDAGIPDTADATREAELKAALLVNLLRFVAWPPGAFASPEDPFRIGILGRDPFGDILNRQISQRKYEHRSLVVVRSDAVSELLDCQVIFASPERPYGIDEIQRAIAGRPILLVGSEEGFAHRGGMVNFLVRDQKPALELSYTAAKKAEIRFKAGLANLKSVTWVDKRDGP